MINASSVIQRAAHLVDASFAAEMATHVSRAEKNLLRLQRAAKAGTNKQVREAQRTFVLSFSAKLCCLILSMERGGDQPLTSLAMYQMAGELNPFSDPGETVRAYAKIKSLRGDWRPICVFGPKRKALQTLANFVLTAKFGPHPLDFMAQDRGIEIAADRIANFIDDGVTTFVVADIANCFRSVKPQEIGHRLGLPSTMVRHCLLIGEKTPILLPPTLPPDTCHQAFSETVRQGLPQGARSSNRVVSLLLGPELRSLTLDDRSILYGDDFAIPTDTQEEARALIKALPGFFEAHPAGSFHLKRCEICNTEEGFNFLKYKFRRDRFTGRARLRPSDLSYHRFAEKVRQIIESAPIPKIYKVVMSYRKRWLNSFGRYQANEIAIEFLQLTVISNLPTFLMERWQASCSRYTKTNIFPPGASVSWID